MASTAFAFIGIGAMGRPMAARLLGAGFPLTVHTRTRAKAESLVAAGATWAATAAEAAAAADVVLTCVTDNAATEEVLFGRDGVTAAAAAGAARVACVVDFSTSGPPTAARIGKALDAKGIGFVDAPVTGGTPRAANGTLTVIASGAAETIALARPAFAVLGSHLFVAGAEPGQAQMVKLVNNMLNYLAMAATAGPAVGQRPVRLAAGAVRPGGVPGPRPGAAPRPACSTRRNWARCWPPSTTSRRPARPASSGRRSRTRTCTPRWNAACWNGSARSAASCAPAGPATTRSPPTCGSTCATTPAVWPCRWSNWPTR